MRESEPRDPIEGRVVVCGVSLALQPDLRRRSIHLYDVQSTGLSEGDDGEGAGHPGVGTGDERDHLHPHVGQVRRLQQMLQLSPHDIPTTDQLAHGPS